MDLLVSLEIKDGQNRAQSDKPLDREALRTYLSLDRRKSNGAETLNFGPHRPTSIAER